MSRAKTVTEQYAFIKANLGERGVTRAIGVAYDAGFLEGSGQSSITPLERQLIAAALDWLESESPMHADNKLIDAARALKDALSKSLELELRNIEDSE
jgi:hypothetical protein